MKRTLSGELSPSPSAINTPDGQPANTGENHQQQANHANNAAPVMRAAAANDPPPQNPLLGFDPDVDLFDWDEFAQMLPHTPPVENRRSESQEEASSVSDAENSDEEGSTAACDLAPPMFKSSSGKSSVLAASENKFKRKILETLAAGGNEVEITEFDVTTFQELLDICNENSQVTNLSISGYSAYLSGQKITANQNIQQSLINFFNNSHTIKEFDVSFMKLLGMEIQPQLLAAIFCSESLSLLRLDMSPFADASPDEYKLVAENIKKNVTLKKLDLRSMENKNVIPLILDPLAQNSGLELISINSKMPVGTGESIARILKSNQKLKCLKIVLETDRMGENIHSEIHSKEFETILNALANNSSLETFRVRKGMWDEESRLLTIMFEPLMANRGLKTLDLIDFDESPPENIPLLVDLTTKHSTLTSIGLIAIPNDEPSRNLFFNGLRSNPNPYLQHIGASWEQIEENDFEWHTEKHFLDSLAGFSQLSSLTLAEFHDLDSLLNFLKDNPNITEINLPDEGMLDREDQKKLMAAVTNSSQIKNFSLSNERSLKDKKALKFRAELKQALLINKEVTSEATILSASAAMAALLLEYSRSNEELPELNPDVLKLLVEAITRYLPPAKAKAIFDELILHAPKRH